MKRRAGQLGTAAKKTARILFNIPRSIIQGTIAIVWNLLTLPYNLYKNQVYTGKRHADMNKFGISMNFHRFRGKNLSRLEGDEGEIFASKGTIIARTLKLIAGNLFAPFWGIGVFIYLVVGIVIMTVGTFFGSEGEVRPPKSWGKTAN